MREKTREIEKMGAVRRGQSGSLHWLVEWMARRLGRCERSNEDRTLSVSKSEKPVTRH